MLVVVQGVAVRLPEHVLFYILFEIRQQVPVKWRPSASFMLKPATSFLVSQSTTQRVSKDALHANMWPQPSDDMYRVMGCHCICNANVYSVREWLPVDELASSGK